MLCYCVKRHCRVDANIASEPYKAHSAPLRQDAVSTELCVQALISFFGYSSTLRWSDLLDESSLHEYIRTGRLLRLSTKCNDQQDQVSSQGPVDSCGSNVLLLYQRTSQKELP